MRGIEKAITEILSSIKPKDKIATSYDSKEDVLYVGFRSSPIQKEEFGVKLGDYIVSFKEDKSVVAITVLNAKNHFQDKFRDMPPLSKENSAVVLV